MQEDNEAPVRAFDLSPGGFKWLQMRKLAATGGQKRTPSRRVASYSVRTRREREERLPRTVGRLSGE